MNYAFLLMLCAWGLFLGCVTLVLLYTHRRAQGVLPNVTDDEQLLLTLVEPSLQIDLLTYVRTMTMTRKLQEALNEDKDVLDAVSFYMLLQTARAEESRRKKAEDNFRLSCKTKKLSEVEKRILQQLDKKN